MDNIIEPNSDFDFGQLSLAYPSGIQGGAYFTKLLSRGKPTYIQTPSSLLKQGFVKSGKKWYCDLMFDASAHELIQWMERLEEKCREMIVGKSADWFQGTLEPSDVESSFGAIMRLYRSGKYYLLRANAKADLSGNPLVRFYSEDQEPLCLDDVQTDTHMVSILEVQGIKFTTRSFQLEFEVKQMMIVDKEPAFDNCLIKGFSKKSEKTKFTNMVKAFDANEKSDSTSATSITCATTLTNVKSAPTNETTLINEKSEATNAMNVKSEPISEPISEATDTSATTLINVKSEAISEATVSATTDTSAISEAISEATVSATTDTSALSELQIDAIDLDESDDIKEMTDLSMNNALDAIQLKKPNQIYFDMYKVAREKAKASKQSAISAYLEARNIKNTYMLNDSDSDIESDLNELEQL